MMVKKMWCLVVLLLFAAVVHGFNNVFIIVVDESAYLSAISGKGHLADYNFTSQTTSVVSTLQSRGMSWKVYTESYKKCTLDASIPAKYPSLIQAGDINSTTCQQIANAAEIDGDANIFKLPTVAFYFPDTSNASSSNWLRSFLHPIFGSSMFLKNTLTIILSQGNQNTTRALLIGRDAQRKEDRVAREALLAKLNAEYGISLIDVPTPVTPMAFDRIFIVILENEPLEAALRFSLMRNNALQGTLLTDFNAVINPSQPNYIALLAGDILGVKDDHVHDLPDRNLIDSFEENGISWKAYMEDYPGHCYAESTSVDKLYWRKHNPFMSFNSVRMNYTRCSKIVHSDQLDYDIQTNSLPKYMFYTPNINNDGHDTNLAHASKWVTDFIVPKLQNQNFMEKTLVVITYDEGVKSDNKIYTLLLGDMVPYGSLDKTRYTHYSLLRLVEDQFRLPLLGRNDVKAVKIESSNFYPGEVEIPPTNKWIFVVIAIGAVVSVTLIAVVVYVVRKRAKKNDFVVLQQHAAFLNEEDDDYDENDEEEGTRLPRRRAAAKPVIKK